MSHSATVAAWRGRERALRARGVHVSLLAASRWHAGGVEVSLATSAGDEATAVRTRGRHPALFVFDPRPIWRALGEQWDVIDIHEEPFALATAEVLLLRALRRNRAPVVLYTAQNIPKRYPVPFRWLERVALRTARGISACNAEAARIVSAKGFAGRARVIPLGIDADEFSPASASSAPLEEDDGSFVAGFVGRLVPEKGIDVLLRAAAAAPGMRVRIAGAGPLAADVPGRAAELGIAGRVELVGAVPPEQVADFYRGIDVLAIPSQATPSWTEQFGRVAVEAMATGVPVVSSDAGALPDVVGGAGIVVPEGDAAALATALAYAAGPRRTELVAAGFARAASCTWDAVASDYLDLYEAVIHRPGDPGPEHRASPGLEIVVVAYGAPDLLRRALAPVAGFPVTVVDNSSLPEIADLCAELGVRYLDPGRNGGFGTGVNVALADRLVPHGDVLLLNPDAVIAPADIARVQSGLHATPGIASAGPVQVDEAGHPARVDWPFPSPAGAWAEAMGLARLRRADRYVIGSVLMLNGAAIDHVGWFDESFFLYAEETDWAYRAKLLGWRHTVTADAKAEHAGAGTSTDATRREVHFHAGQERFYRKHFGALGWTMTRFAVWAGATVRGILLPGDRGRAAWRRAALYARGPLKVERRRYPEASERR
ncbi:group 1 glycosyl transferase [Microbacterium mangrovi]|uniref:D-inositol 3-phosphate glycosyltransferase n=1 Tax=Microbacterium mangrovi TaxID=1348253 RepID=A0A0B2ACP9_9MICO|nr:group 1 glycosyl transferase [Microbacterium mangrovi]